MPWGPKLKRQLSLYEPPIPAPALSSAVLMAVGREPDGVEESIILTKRTLWVETHKGQVSFPGGFHDPSDRTLLETALRESREEIGIEERHVEVVGPMAPVETRGGIVIYPWVARFRLPYPFQPNPAEVERILFLPLSQLLREGLATVEVTLETGACLQSPGLYCQGELIWGATARLLEQFRQALLALDRER